MTDQTTPTVADVPPHLRGAISPERWAQMCRDDAALDAAEAATARPVEVTNPQRVCPLCGGVPRLRCPAMATPDAAACPPLRVRS